jgi:antitoxin VapB
MQHVAKLFNNGRSQAVRLPAAFRFEEAQVYIRQDADTQDVILSRRPQDWAGFFAAAQSAQAAGQIQADFLDAAERGMGLAAQERDPFEAVELVSGAANSQEVKTGAGS